MCPGSFVGDVSIYFVGAAIGRPAHKFFIFASDFGEIVRLNGTGEQCSPLHILSKM